MQQSQMQAAADLTSAGFASGQNGAEMSLNDAVREEMQFTAEHLRGIFGFQLLESTVASCCPSDNFVEHFGGKETCHASAAVLQQQNQLASE